jgi:hypothetical protein
MRYAGDAVTNHKIKTIWSCDLLRVGSNDLDNLFFLVEKSCDIIISLRA